MKKFINILFLLFSIFFANISLQAQCAEWQVEPKLKYYHIEEFSDGLAVAILKTKMGLKYGFIDKMGQVVIPFEFDGALNFTNGIARIEKNRKWGLIDKEGREIISPKYDQIEQFTTEMTNELLEVELNGKCGFINRFGKEIIPLIYDRATSFVDGLARVWLKGMMGFVDKTGQQVIPLIYDFCSDFKEEKALVKINRRYGFVNKKGEIIIPLIYNLADSFSDGVAGVELNGKTGFIDGTGKEIIPIKFDDYGPIFRFSDGLARVERYIKVKDEFQSRFGFINKKGEVVIPFEYKFAMPFEDGLACVENNDKYGLINTKGEKIAPMIYDKIIFSFREELALVALNNHSGFINKEGLQVIPLIYEYANNFSEGLAAVKINEKWGILKNPLKQVPNITWRRPSTYRTTVTSNNFSVEAQIISSSDIKAKTLYINGIEQGTDRSQSIVAATNDCKTTYKSSILLRGGENRIMLSITNAAGTTTSEERIVFVENGSNPLPPRTKEKRLALIIGNGLYENGSILPNPTNDAKSMESVLKELDFEVVKYENLGLQPMEDVIKNFTKKLENYDVGLFFYAGHGLEVGGVNYLLPVDIKSKLQKEEVKYKCISSDYVQDIMSAAGTENKIFIVILDACRNNPFRIWRSTPTDAWVTPQNVPSGLIAAYATSQGQTACDGAGNNGCYTSILLRHIKTPNIQIEELFKRVRIELKQKTGQEPVETTKLTKDFYFVRQ